MSVESCRIPAQKIHSLLKRGWQSQKSIYEKLETTEARAYISELRQVLPPNTIQERWRKHPRKPGCRFKEWRIRG